MLFYAVCFVIDMGLAGLSIGMGIKFRDSWFAVFNWVLAFIYMAGAFISLSLWLGVKTIW